MTAPVSVEAACSVDELHRFFAELCEHRAGLYAEGILTLHEAVDELQAFAVLSGLVEAIGQHAVQETMAFSGECDAGERVDYDVGHVAQILAQWEADDAKRPAPAPRTEPRRGVPQSTIDAFKFVVSLGDPDYLAKWLRDHSDVARALLDEVE
jgi:hypothetical protein